VPEHHDLSNLVNTFKQFKLLALELPKQLHLTDQNVSELRQTLLMTKLFGKCSFVFPQRHPKMQQIISFDAFSLTMPSQFLVD